MMHFILLMMGMRPAIGSLVYCNLGVVAEHSGIYVSRNKIVHLSGDGHIEKVSAKKHCERLTCCYASTVKIYLMLQLMMFCSGIDILLKS